MKIVLVACVSQKQNDTSPARDLYCSPWFTKASQYALQVADQWFILSAQYGLVQPDQVIGPYNQTLNSMPITARICWSEKVLSELQPYLSAGDRVIFLAGRRYREYLVDPIHRAGCQVVIPMEGLGIGQQLRWLNQQIEGNRNGPLS